MDEDIRELEYELVDFQRSSTWRCVMQPSLERRKKDIERKLAIGLSLDLDKIRELQVQYKFISDCLESPIKFFGYRD